MQTTVPEVPVEHARHAVSVLVVHPEEVVCAGWRLLLSRQSWTKRFLAAKDERSGVALARRYGPTVAILDLDQGIDPIGDLAMKLHEAAPEIEILLIAGRNAVTAKAAAFIGATGVVHRTLPLLDLSRAVHHVASGQRIFAAPTPRGAGQLSAREQQVLQLLCGGATNLEIAGDLHVSPETIKQHAKAIYRKLGVRNRTEAARQALQLGMAAPESAVAA